MFICEFIGFWTFHDENEKKNEETVPKKDRHGCAYFRHGCASQEKTWSLAKALGMTVPILGMTVPTPKAASTCLRD